MLKNKVFGQPGGGELIAGNNSIISISKDCFISYDVHIRTTMHKYDSKNILISKQGEIEKSIIIEDDCWIGFSTQIMPGVKIAKGSVIGAGAVVTKDTEEYSVYVGVPAKKIKERKEMKYDEEKNILFAVYNIYKLAATFVAKLSVFKISFFFWQKEHFACRN